MSALKTQKNDGDVIRFLNAVDNPQRREDSFSMLKLMEEVTGETAVMWGESIIGFGSYRYQYASGRKGEWFLTGFAPRKQNLTLYIMAGFEEYDGQLVMGKIAEQLIKETIRLLESHLG